MKIVFLNCLNAEVRGPLAEFIERHIKDTDIFCFQEAFEGMQQLGDQLLGDYRRFSAYKKIAENDNFAQLTYVKKNWEVLSSGTILEEVRDTGIGLYVVLRAGRQMLHVCNVHGRSRPGDKLDNPIRLQQSRGLIDFFKNKTGPIIIGGDFNLLPETASINMFEDNGYRHLIASYHIVTTRNRLAWEKFPAAPQLYADYVFLRGVDTVRDFSVPDIEVSDHLPLLLNIKVESQPYNENVLPLVEVAYVDGEVK